MSRRKAVQWTIVGILLAILCAADILIGEIELDGSSLARTVLGQIRIPRVLTALGAGACMAVSGALLQAVFRNPLADPHILGISSGAGLGAACATMSGIPLFGGIVGITSSAIAGAFASSLIVIGISQKFRSSTVVLLGGVMLGFIFSAIVSVMQYTSSEESLKLFSNWAAGSFSSGGWGAAKAVWAGILGGLPLGVLLSKGLDIGMFGEEFAQVSGCRITRIRSLAILGCCLMTGCVTAFCGPIGFIGIVAPHIARMFCGSSVHRRVIPMCAILGSILAVCADIVSVIFPFPIPAGSVVAILGIPVIFYIMSRR